jgi:hypothetical protein
LKGELTNRIFNLNRGYGTLLAHAAGMLPNCVVPEVAHASFRFYLDGGSCMDKNNRFMKIIRDAEALRLVRRKDNEQSR